MSESRQSRKRSRQDSVIEVLSDNSDSPPPLASRDHPHRRHSVIEVLSDESDDDGDVEFVAEAPAEVQFTGSNIRQLPQVYFPPQNSPPTLPPPNLPPPHYQYHFPRGRAQRRFARNARRRPNPDDILVVDYHHNGREGPLPLFVSESVPEMLLHQQRALFRMFHTYAPQDGVSNTIMERLARDDEAALDRKMESENIHNRKVLQQKKQVAEGGAEGHTSDITRESDLGCELCGVMLGQGIPEDFKPDARYDEHFEELASAYRVNAPWFCIRQCFDTDVALSKRVFVAKCGHVFCGRCIKNIGNRAPGRVRKNMPLSITNPQICAPRRCPAPGCDTAFKKGKKTFTELFL